MRWGQIKLGVVLAAMVVALSVSCTGAYAAETVQAVRILAQKFAFAPNEILLKQGVPVEFEFTSLDRLHGFSCPELGLRADIVPGKSTVLRFVPQKTGSFTFRCDIFCGDGHEEMEGIITVKAGD